MVVALRGIPAVSSPSKHGLRRKGVRSGQPKTETVTLVGIPALMAPVMGPHLKPSYSGRFFMRGDLYVERHGIYDRRY